MGHDLPRALWPELIDAIAAHVLGAGSGEPADGGRGAARDPSLQTRGWAPLTR